MYNYYDGQNQNMSPYNNYGRMNYNPLNNNCNCNICSSPVTLQVKNTTETTLTNVNITVDKLA